MPKSTRTKCYTLLAIGQKQLGWDDEFYRDTFLAQHGAKPKNGKVSASTMSIGQLYQAVQAMKNAGFKPTPPKMASVTPISDWRTPRIGKIRALWKTLAEAGAVDQAEASMLKWCLRITGTAQLNWCDSTDLNNCIESLKQKAARDGVKLRA